MYVKSLLGGGPTIIKVNTTDSEDFAVIDPQVPLPENPTDGQVVNFIDVGDDGTPAFTSFLANGSDFANGDVVTVGGKPYTLETVLTDVDGHVLLGGSSKDTIANLDKAVILGDDVGVSYAASTTLPVNFSCIAESDDELTFFARFSGTAGNSIATTVSLTNPVAAFTAAVMAGGLDDLTHVGNAQNKIANIVTTDSKLIYNAGKTPTMTHPFLTTAGSMTFVFDARRDGWLVMPEAITYRFVGIGNDQNNYQRGGALFLLVFVNAAPRTVTGIEQGRAGELLTITTDASGDDLLFLNESGLSLENNRIITLTGFTLTLSPGDTARFLWSPDEGAASPGRWRQQP